MKLDLSDPEYRRHFEQLIIAEIDAARRLFDANGNPLLVWRAYRMARQIGASTPEWVNRHFDEVASRLYEADVQMFEHDRDGKRLPDHRRQLLDAFGFAKHRNPFVDLGQAEATGLYLARHMRVLIADGHSEMDAAFEIETRGGFSESTVKRAWRKYRAVAEAENLERQREELETVDRQVRETYGLTEPDDAP